MSRLTYRENENVALSDYTYEEMKDKFLDHVNDVVDCVNLETALEKLADYEDFTEIFEKHFSVEALELLSDKEEFSKWLERGKWIAIQCDKSYREAQAFKDKQEQGLLLELPCKVGTIVWLVHKTITGKRFVKEGYDHLGLKGHEEYVYGYEIRKIPFSLNNIKEFGKTVFLTRVEAEEALAKITK